MRHKLGVALGGAVLGLAGLLATASSGTASPTTAPTTAPTPRPPVTCPPVIPISGSVTAATATSLTISYSIFLGPPCGYDPPITVTLYGSAEDARQRQNPVAEAVSGPERYGPVLLEGLTPDTPYWFRFSAGDQPDPYVVGSGRTAPMSACAATVAIANAWGSGFLATITVRNGGAETLDAWQVSWRWPGAERIVALWNGVAQDGDAGVTIRNASWNATLAPGGSTTFGMVVAAGAPPAQFALTCTEPAS